MEIFWVESNPYHKIQVTDVSYAIRKIFADSKHCVSGRHVFLDFLKTKVKEEKGSACSFRKLLSSHGIYEKHKERTFLELFKQLSLEQLETSLTIHQTKSSFSFALVYKTDIICLSFKYRGYHSPHDSGIQRNWSRKTVFYKTVEAILKLQNL